MAGPEVSNEAPKADDAAAKKPPLRLSLSAADVFPQAPAGADKKTVKADAAKPNDSQPVTPASIGSTIGDLGKKFHELQTLVQSNSNDPVQLAKLQNELKTGINQAIKDAATLKQPDTANSTITPMDKINKQIADLTKQRVATAPGTARDALDDQIKVLAQAQDADGRLLNLKGAALQQGLIHAGDAPETGRKEHDLGDVTEALRYTGEASRSDTRIARSPAVFSYYSNTLKDLTAPFADPAHPDQQTDQQKALNGVVKDLSAVVEPPPPGQPPKSATEIEGHLKSADAAVDKFYKEQYGSLNPAQQMAFLAIAKEAHMQSADYYYQTGRTNKDPEAAHPLLADAYLRRAYQESGGQVEADPSYQKMKALTDKFERPVAPDGNLQMQTTTSQAAYDKWNATLQTKDPVTGAVKDVNDTSNWQATQQAFKELNTALVAERADLTEAQKVAMDPTEKARADAALMQQTSLQLYVRSREIALLNKMYTTAHDDDKSPDKYKKTNDIFNTLQTDYNLQRGDLTKQIKDLQETEKTQGLSAADAQYKKGLQGALSIVNSYQAQRTWDQAFIDNAANHKDDAHAKFKLLQDQLSHLTVTRSQTELKEDPQAIKTESEGINQHTNGQNYVKADADGNRFYKDDQHNYGLLWVKPKDGETGDGKYFALDHGHVFNYDINQHTKGAEVTGKDVPSQIKLNSNGSIDFGHLNMRDNGDVRDSDMNLKFQGHVISAQIDDKPPVVASSVGGKETLVNGGQRSDYDPKSQGKPPEPLVVAKGDADNNWGNEGKLIASYFNDPTKVGAPVDDPKSGGKAEPTLDWLVKNVYEPGFWEKHWKTALGIGIMATGTVLSLTLVGSEVGVPMMIAGGALFVGTSAGLGALGGAVFEGHSGSAMGMDAAEMGLQAGVSLLPGGLKLLKPVVAPLVAPVVAPIMDAVAPVLEFARPAGAAVNAAANTVSKIPYVGAALTPAAKSVLPLTGVGTGAGLVYGELKGDHGWDLAEDTAIGTAVGFGGPQVIAKAGLPGLVDGLGFGSRTITGTAGTFAIAKNTALYLDGKQDAVEAQAHTLQDFVSYTMAMSIASGIGNKVPTLIGVERAMTSRSTAQVGLDAAERNLADALKSGDKELISKATAAREAAAASLRSSNLAVGWRVGGTFPAGVVSGLGMSNVMYYAPMAVGVVPDKRFDFLNDKEKIRQAMPAFIPQLPPKMNPKDPTSIDQ